jgi:hypothetical protein
MQVKAFILLFGASMIVAGCGSPGNSSVTPPPVAPDLTGNWQIQSNPASGTNPLTAIALLGALESNGNQVSGTFRFTNLSDPTTCGLDQVVTLTGAVDSNGNLTLTSSTLPNGTTIKAQMAISGAQPPYAGAGTIEVDGTTCTFATAPSIGEQFLNTSGAYAGTFTPGTLGSPSTGPSAAVSLTLTQLAIPGPDGQFAANGTINYQIGSCSGSAPISGDVSGVGVTLLSESTPPASPQVLTFIGTSNPAATAISAGALIFVPAPCSSDPTSNVSYFGQLNRQ